MSAKNIFMNDNRPYCSGVSHAGFGTSFHGLVPDSHINDQIRMNRVKYLHLCAIVGRLAVSPLL